MRNRGNQRFNAPVKWILIIALSIIAVAGIMYFAVQSDLFSRDVTWKTAPQAIRNFPIIKPVGKIEYNTFPSVCTCGAEEDPGWWISYKSEANKQDLLAIINPYMEEAKKSIRDPKHEFRSYIGNENNNGTSTTHLVVECYYYLGPSHQ